MVDSFSSSDSDSTTTTTTDSNTATYAGIMVSVFTFGEFIMAPQWARISDRIGRKPTLLVGSVGGMISAMVFGFSNSLPMAIAARTFAGVANPNLGVVKTFVGELVRKDHQGKMCHVLYCANSLRESRARYFVLQRKDFLSFRSFEDLGKCNSISSSICLTYHPWDSEQ
jgi:MFS family permease